MLPAVQRLTDALILADIMEKANLIYSWLMNGKVVKKVGVMHGAISRTGNMFHYSNYGSSAIKATLENLTWLLTEIFDRDQEFYIIDDGKMYSTNKLIEETGGKEYTFTLYARNIWTLQETPLKQYRMTTTEMLMHYDDIAEQYAKENPNENHVHFAISSENPFFNYWNFAI